VIYKLGKQTDASTFDSLDNAGGDGIIYWRDLGNGPGNIEICGLTGVPYDEGTDAINGVYLIRIGIKADSSSAVITGEIIVKIQFTLGVTLTCSESIMWDSSLLTTEYTEPYMGVSLD